MGVFLSLVRIYTYRTEVNIPSKKKIAFINCYELQNIWLNTEYVVFHAFYLS